MELAPHPDLRDPRARPSPHLLNPERSQESCGPGRWAQSAECQQTGGCPRCWGEGAPCAQRLGASEERHPLPRHQPRACCLPGLPVTPAPADSTGRRRAQGSPTASLGHPFSPGSQSPQAHSLPVCPGPTPPVLLVGPSPRPPGPAPTPFRTDHRAQLCPPEWSPAHRHP